MKFLKEKLDWLIGFLVIIEGAQFIVAFFGRNSSVVVQFFDAHELSIVSVLSLISLIALFFVLFILSKERKARQDTADQLEAAQNQINLLKFDTEKLSKFKEKFEDCAQRYKSYAMQNSNCDVQIFDDLFEVLLTDKERLKSNLDSARRSSLANLRDILDTVSYVLTAHIGEKTSACVQIIHHLAGKSLDSAVIRTLERDRDSYEKRQIVNGDENNIRGNSIHQQIFVSRNNSVLINDLDKEKRENPSFKTTSQTLKEVYNAVLIIPLPRAKTPAPGDWDGPIATLCVDNRNGNFDENLHIHVLQEFGWRISMELYRLQKIEHAFENVAGL